MRIFPEMCARTRWPLASSTRNMAFGRGSTTVPSTSMAPSFFGKLFPSPVRLRARQAPCLVARWNMGSARAEAHSAKAWRSPARIHKVPKRRLACNNGGFGGARGLLALADEDADAPQGRADRHHRALEPEQQQGLGADEGVGDQGGDLLGGEGAEGAEAALGLAGDVGQQHVPAPEQVANQLADLGVGPTDGQTLL